MVDDFSDVTGLNRHEDLQRQPSFILFNRQPDDRQTQSHQDIMRVTAPSHHISPQSK